MNRKIYLIIMSVIISVFVISCDKSEVNKESDIIVEQVNKESNVDIDLTNMSSVMVYSEVFNMMSEPEQYIGKVIKANGTLDVATDIETQKKYFAVLVADALSCCSQGIEFVWKGEHVYPDEYPELGAEITVTGTFSQYEENGYTFYTLKDANLEY